jgi:hypothetical protein
MRRLSVRAELPADEHAAHVQHPTRLVDLAPLQPEQLRRA